MRTGGYGGGYGKIWNLNVKKTLNYFQFYIRTGGYGGGYGRIIFYFNRRKDA